MEPTTMDTTGDIRAMDARSVAKICSGQVVVDLWDAADGSAEPDLMGKAVISLDECRPGVPHTFFKNMLVGKLAFRVLFDHGDLPDATEEAAQVQQSLATALS